MLTAATIISPFQSGGRFHDVTTANNLHMFSNQLFATMDSVTQIKQVLTMDKFVHLTTKMKLEANLREDNLNFDSYYRANILIFKLFLCYTDLTYHIPTGQI